MRAPPLYTSWLVQCSSPEAAQALQRRLIEQIRLDAVVGDLVKTYDGGVEKSHLAQHRLGDYFADIRLLPAPGNVGTAFRIVFHRLDNSGRFWKDLMVNILQIAQDSPGKSTITLEYKGDDEPLEAARTH